MFRCIRCLNEFDDSAKTEEHVFPKSIGNNTIKIYDICKPCNDHFGGFVDGPLINNFWIDTRRMILRLGESGKVPNPLENGVLAENPKLKVKFDIEKGIPKSSIVNDVIDGTDKNGNPIISITLDKSKENELTKILAKKKTRYARDGKNVEFNIINQQDVRIENPLISYKHHFHNDNWKRGIIKIAYELAYRFIGPSYLDDPVAGILRNILFPDNMDKDTFKKYPLRGSIGLATNKPNDPFFSDPNALYGRLIHESILKTAIYRNGTFSS